MHATEFSQQVSAADTACMVVLVGNERHLKQQTVNLLCQHRFGSSAEDSIGLVKFGAKDLEYRAVHDELAMFSMFSPSKIVLVEDADDFVKKYRPQLENYADKPSQKSLLVLDVESWLKTTKLAKKVAKSGLNLECTELTGGKLTSWLTRRTSDEYQKKLSRDAAALLVELAGTGLSLLDQELQKLASYVGERNSISAEDVRVLVGGWKAETTWTMIDAIRDNHPDLALTCLNKLLHAGESPQKIIGGMTFVFRKYAQTAELVRSGMPLKAAMKEAKIFFREMESAEQYLMRIRRPRALRIMTRLAETDFGLRGGSSLPDTQQMESLVLWLTGVLPEDSLN